MEWIIERLVNRQVWNDPRTDMSDGTMLGYPFEIIRNQVLKKGLTDFSKGFPSKEFGDLTPDDVALLFCYVMMKRHFFACMATFEIYEKKIEKCFGRKTKPVFVDFGCGPATACFAFADLFPGQKFHYIGVESAPPMRRKAVELWNAARKNGLLCNGHGCEFFPSWRDLPLETLKADTPLLLVFSYFFASHSLTIADIKSLALSIFHMVETCNELPPTMIYVNSPHEIANRKYGTVKKEFDRLGISHDQGPPTPLSIQFRKKRGGTLSCDDFVHQMICLKRR